MAGRPHRRAFGHVRKRASGRWQASYIGPDLVRHTAPHTFDAKQDADAWLVDEHRRITADTWTLPARRGSPASRPNTVRSYAEDWLAGRDLRPRTLAHYRALLDSRILPGLGDLEVKRLSPPVIRSWYATLDAGTPTMRAHSYSLLRGILAAAVQDGLLPSNPCHLRGAGATKRARQIKPLSLDELAALVQAMPAKYRAAVLLSCWCSLRFGELTELRRRDVDLKAGVIHVRRAVAWVDSKPVVGKSKTAAGARDVAIPPHLIPALKAHLDDHAQWGRDGLLFPSPQGMHLTTSTLYASFWPARRKIGREDVSWHGLRHTGATLAALSGATLAELMSRLGHTTPAAAMIYQHAAAGRDAQIAAALSRLSEASLERG
jgi:integrase